MGDDVVSLTQSMETFIAALTRRVTHSAFRKSQAFVHLNFQMYFHLENIVYSLKTLSCAEFLFLSNYHGLLQRWLHLHGGCIRSD